MSDDKIEITIGKLSADCEYIRKTNAEIRELAMGVRAGSVFGTWAIPEHDMHLTSMIFMCSIFIDDLTRKAMERDEIVHFYEYMSNAGPRSINGYPIFFSMYLLNREDTTRLNEALKKINEFMADENAAD